MKVLMFVYLSALVFSYKWMLVSVMVSVMDLALGFLYKSVLASVMVTVTDLALAFSYKSVLASVMVTATDSVFLNKSALVSAMDSGSMSGYTKQMGLQSLSM
jgi:hypothetical protein